MRTQPRQQSEPFNESPPRNRRMQVVSTIAALRDALRQIRQQRNHHVTVGFVPTMGYLHEGHISLFQEARRRCHVVVASVFVNPLQFGPCEDFATYPRDCERDRALAERGGVDLLFTPAVEEIYPQVPLKRQTPSPRSSSTQSSQRLLLTTVSVAQVGDGLCGASRPGHFDGVTTVVAKLFNIVQPDKAFFGLKDVQQVAVITQMVTDLNMPVDIVACPTLRETDGLAISSRNVYLTSPERRQAPILYRTLREAARRVREGQWRTAAEVTEWVRTTLATAPLARVDYVELRTFPELRPVDLLAYSSDCSDDFARRESDGVDEPDRSIDSDELGKLCESYVLAVAVYFGRTRLIDNVVIDGEGALP